MKTTISFLFLLLFLGSNAQFCNIKKHHFQGGEKLSYEVYYHWGFMWVSAGWVNFNTTTENYNGTNALHFKSYGKSYPKWNWFYEVDDKYESYVDKINLNPLYFSRDVHENNLIQQEEYYFNTAENKIKTKSRKQEGKKTNEASWVEKELQMKKCTFDPITMIYYARCINFEKYTINQQIPITMVIDGEIHDVFIRYLGKEKKEIKNQGTYNTLKFSALLVEGTIFKGGEGMTVWITDDENRLPLLIESEVLVGEILVVMSNTEGLKFPSTAKIQD